MLGDDLAQTLPELREQAESMMRDACTISRLGVTQTDPDTGEITAPSEQVYVGRARVQTFEPHEQTSEAGGATSTVQRYAVHVPVGSYRPEVGDVVTITASPLDPHLTGREFRVVALLHKTLATAYRLAVHEEVA